jgi:hypothetical protein
LAKASERLPVKEMVVGSNPIKTAKKKTFFEFEILKKCSGDRKSYFEFLCKKKVLVRIQLWALKIKHAHIV